MVENERTTSLYWCKNCGVPLLKKGCENCGQDGNKICSDLKPMFKEECEFLEKEIEKKLPGKGWQDGLWMRQKTIWYNGKHFLRLSADGKPTIVKEYNENWDIPINKPTEETLYKANKSTLDVLENEAISFIQTIVNEHPIRKPVVSFSGGKDSTVVSHLIRRALTTNDVLHLFGDTTIEYPDTYEYIDKYSKGKSIPFESTNCGHSFIEMCNLLDPPSRINAWCCSVFKAGPISSIMNTINGKNGVISFEGIRKSESNARRNRERIYVNKKIVHQISAYPILEWKEVDVWLYILTKRLDFNVTYRKGLPRVGCIYCPYNAAYTDYLLKIIYQKEVQKWEDFLLKYAKNIGKEDPEEYVSSGAWKRRVGKSNGESLIYVKKVPSAKNENIMHFILNKKMEEDFLERFKPFGKIESISENVDNGFIVKNASTNESLFMIRRLGEKSLYVDLLTEKNKHYLLQHVEKQIRKYQACILCGACTGICPEDAIKINPHFRVIDDRCSRCGRCLTTKFIGSSCISLNSQRQSRGFLNVNRIY